MRRSLHFALLVPFLASVPACSPEAPASPTSSHDRPRPATARVHNRPMKKVDGRTLLWASEDPATGEIEWFDMTDALVDPTQFQYGIGKDRIRSIDDPQFAAVDDPRIAGAGIGDETDVIGHVQNGVAKAYPIFILDRVEVVNDDFAGEPFAVCW